MTHPAPSHSPNDPPPLTVSPHLLTWWFSLTSVGGLVIGLFNRDYTFAKGVVSHPLVIFFAVVVAALLTLRSLYGGLFKVISAPSLAVGFAIAIGCYFIGVWFGVSLAAMP